VEAAEYDVVGETPGLCLMRGLGLVHPDGDTGPMGVAPGPAKLAAQVGDHLRDRNIIIGVGGYHKNAMQFQPPLALSSEQLQGVVDGLRNALGAVT